jgi:hypothetical protein
MNIIDDEGICAPSILESKLQFRNDPSSRL